MSDGAPAGAGAVNARRLAQAAGIVMLAFVASGVLGLVRQAAIGAAFGEDVELDAFVAAQRVPETLFVLVAGGALGSAFIPVLASYLAKSDEVSARRLTDAVITLLVIVSGMLADRKSTRLNSSHVK